ncbi:Acetamidase/formamidase [Halopenitus malekzadehii]|uniref:Acetamidase/formamidase n=1 Tax=Halopenitus malekzadehii TaxID=1267564 RepID=A0A1H6J3R6_9EURY|nr:acetamidase/formamidase family protein [Halopenitus malekzadehii]SEH56269.1 Acetamidase/formamidase [Halopenitus malekzadehii]
MKSIAREDATKYEFGRDMEPLLEVSPGESFRVETWDAFEGVLFDHGFGEFTAEDVPNMQAPPPVFDANPLAGPIYVDGAERGDTLAVTVEEIRPQRGVTTTMEGFGSLAGRSGWEECPVNHAHEVTLKPGPSGTTADGTAHLEIEDHEWAWDLNPHIGTITTAPGRTVQESVTSQGPWGGNMDVRDLNQGSTVYLTSFNDGGLLFVGDVHASQSDSEYTGIAVESTAEIVLSIDIVETPVPGVFRIEDDESIIHVDSALNAGTVEEAVNGCFVAMMEELVSEHGLSKREAYVQMSVNPAVTVRLYQFVYPGFATFGVKLDKSFLDQFA